MKIRLLAVFFSLVVIATTFAQTATNITVLDTRDSNESPNAYTRLLQVDFKNRSVIGSPGSGIFGGTITLAPWASDGTGNKHHQLHFNDGGIFYRTGVANSTSWDSWRSLVLGDANGNVGIGTNPQSKLHILDGNNNIRLGDFGSSTAGIELSDGNINSPSSVYLLGWGNSFRVGMGGVNESNHMFTILNNGNVGIGTMTPEANLHIKHTPTTLNAFVRIESLYSGQNASVQYVSGGVWRWEAGTGISSGTSYEIYDRVSDKSCLVIKEGGNMGIGTNTPGEYKLNVWGKIRAHEIVVNTSGADFVFETNYKLRTLSELETYINTNKHLPDIAPAKEMKENGVSAGEMQTKLLQKVEELTLYVIELKKENEKLKAEKDKQINDQNHLIANQQQVLMELKQQIDQLKK